MTFVIPVGYYFITKSKTKIIFHVGPKLAKDIKETERYFLIPVL